MTSQHLITPPPELLAMWAGFAARHHAKESVEYVFDVADKAACWGADQELEACCEWLKAKEWIHPEFSDELRTARRPKPQSLKEQALGALYAIATGADDTRGFHQDLETIKTALEQLDD